uniref:Uncharacterized protein n=1 Tax=Tanacetum cinerariifolium TaxID=118510 RepID=A0A699KPR4_TANCI|nr:hypothetical protein [Tanacetum cinerariifolium]
MLKIHTDDNVADLLTKAFDVSRDAYEKKLIQMLKIHTDDNVADLLTKAFDVSRRKRLLVKTSQIRSWLTIYQKLYGFQPTMLHRKELADPKQTDLGKDESNPLIVDSLVKTIWSSMHHVIAMKHWLFQSRRLLVKKP